MVYLKEDVKCNAYLKNKMVLTSHKGKNVIYTRRPLELLHVNLSDPTKTLSLDKNRCSIVILDDFSRYTWVLLLCNKCDAFAILISLQNKFKIKKVIP